MSNNFLGSTVSNSDLATETTSGKILDKLKTVLTILPTTTINVQTDTGDLVDVSIDQANITGTIPASASISSVTITDFHLTEGQPSNGNAFVTNGIIFVNSSLDNVAGTATEVNTGNAGNGTQRVVLASNQPTVNASEQNMSKDTGAI